MYKEAKQWDEAEKVCREALCIQDSIGDLTGAAQTANLLAVVTTSAGKPEAAEAWFRKAIEDARDRLQVSVSLCNLANLLQNQANRLQEAQQLAEEALAISKTLDPAAAKIWTIYTILADIANKQHDTTQAQEYRRLSREAMTEFAGTKYELRKHGHLIAAVVAVADKAEARKELEPALEGIAKRGFDNFSAAIRRLLEGERDEDVVCEPLDGEEAAIINAILRGIADPETLKPLLEGQED